MRRRSAGVAIAALLVLATASAALVAADPEYDLTVVGAIDTPTETVTIDDEEYEIDEIGVIEPGEPIEAHVTASKRDWVVLYDTDKNAEHQVQLSDNDTVVTMDSDDLDPGTYMLSLDSSGVQAVAPIVVEGYDLDLEFPSSAERGSVVQFAATAEPIDGGSQPDEVEVAIWDGDDVTEVTLDHAGGTSYETTVSLSSFDTGTYHVYGTIVGDDTVDGYPTALAVEDGASLTVTDDASDGDENDDGSDGTDGTGGGSEEDGDDSDEREADGERGDESDTDDANEGTTDDGSDGDSDDSDAGNDPSGDDDVDDENDDVIEPNESDDADDGESTSGDELGAPAAVQMVIAIGAILLLAVGRSRRNT